MNYMYVFIRNRAQTKSIYAKAWNLGPNYKGMTNRY